MCVSYLLSFLQVRIGDSLSPPGGIEGGGSEYRELYSHGGSLTNVRVKPNWYSDLMTPYGAYAEGQPRQLGQPILA